MGLPSISQAQRSITVLFDTNLVTVDTTKVTFAKELPVLVDTVFHVDTVRVVDTVWVRDTAVTPPPTTSSLSVPFGPTQLYDEATDTWHYGPKPFNFTRDGSTVGTLFTTIAHARKDSVKIILNLTGGAASQYLTNGKWDFNKWYSKLKTYDTKAVKDTIAKAVAEGVVIGYSLQDEPNNPKWGGVMTKAWVDSMARTSKRIFPTLPTGVTEQYDWRKLSETYKDLDFQDTQFRYTKGPLLTYRDSAVAVFKRNGIKPVFSYNLTAGGQRNGTSVTNPATCPFGGEWNDANTIFLCHAGPDEIKTVILTFAQAAPCALNTWQAEDWNMNQTYMNAYKFITDSLKKLPKQSCTRN